MRSWLMCLLLASMTLSALAGQPPAPREVEIAAPDGVKLKATYYPAAKAGPAVLLLHMCNTTRKSWEPVPAQLSAAGIHALALDYRGYGESGGERYTDNPQKQLEVITTKWPGDTDAALAFLVSQPGVDKTRMGAGGGSCGVNQAIQFARRHPEQVKSLVLLAGGTNRDGLRFLQQNPWLPIFASAAADDQFDSDAPRTMRWFTELSGNPRNKFAGFADGKHGTEIFPVHPELPREIVTWYVDTLVKTAAGSKTAVAAKTTATAEFWAALDQPEGVARAVQTFHQARQKDPGAYLFPEAVMNLAGYERLQAGKASEAIELFKLNVEAFPASANTYDSLGDAYLAAGQEEQALRASQKALELLPADKANDALKNAIRQSAEEKIKKLKS